MLLFDAFVVYQMYMMYDMCATHAINLTMYTLTCLAEPAFSALLQNLFIFLIEEPLHYQAPSPCTF